MATFLDWSRFRGGRVGPEKAFEAFTAQLFERWLRREYASVMESYTLHGDGGDGGVEAFGRLRDGSVIGFQAKWFEGNLNASRIKQIRGSIDQARRTFPSLQTYVVAFRLNLTKGRPRKPDSAKPPEQGGVERWAQLVADCAVDHRGLDLVRWDEAALNDELAASGNDELRGLWFEGDFSQQTLQIAWEKCRAQLNERYLPDLHAGGAVEETLDCDLWTSYWIDWATSECSLAKSTATEASTYLDGFGRTAGVLLAEEVSEKLGVFGRWNGELVDYADTLLGALRRWPSSELEESPPGMPLQGAREVYRLIEENHQFTHTREWLERAVVLAEKAFRQLREVRRRIRDSAAPRFIVGPAGSGKTHAAARVVDEMNEAGQPALLLLGKHCDPALGAASVLATALDLPAQPLRRLLDGLEALATLHQIEAGPDASFARSALVIDGLEEAPSATRWCKVLSDLEVECRGRPRIHLVATMRPEFVNREDVDLPTRSSWLHLHETGNVDLAELLLDYARAFHVDLSDVPWLPWAVRTPLEVRLLAEAHRGQRLSAEDGLSTRAPALFKRRMRAIEREAGSRSGDRDWPESIHPVQRVLEILSILAGDATTTWFRDDAIVKMAQQLSYVALDANRVHVVLRSLREHGLVDRRTPPSRGLFDSPAEFSLSTRHLADFILASRLAELTLSEELGGGKQPLYPPQLRNRPEAAVLYVAALAEGGYFATDLDWDEPPENLEGLYVSALALLPHAAVAGRRDETIDGLLGSTPSNRLRLDRLIVPIARYPDHPLGPRVLDEALRRIPMSSRDQLWSVPENLGGTGIWAGWTRYTNTLESIVLVETDAWDGLPLAVAWGCASVVESRRKQCRESLAIWGAMRLDHMAMLLEHMADVDDPQVIGDLVVATLGAVLGAHVDDPFLPPLARLVDQLFFTEDNPRWTTSVIVRRAGRGVVERAALVCPGEFEEELLRARPPYSPSVEWPKADQAELTEDSTLNHIVTRDLRWYVIKYAFEELFKPKPTSWLGVAKEGPEEAGQSLVAEPEEQQAESRQSNEMRAMSLDELSALVRQNYEAEHGEGADAPEGGYLDWSIERFNSSLPPPVFSQPAVDLVETVARSAGLDSCEHEAAWAGLVAHLVKTWGWSHQNFCHFEWKGPPSVVDDAIAQQHGSGARHGIRSQVCRLREKYVWAAVDLIAGVLADRLPVWSEEDGEWQLLRSLEGVGNRAIDPLPAPEIAQPLVDEPGLMWNPPGVTSPQFEDEPDLVRRADLWVKSAAMPDPRRLVIGDAEDWRPAAILSLQRYQRGHQFCIDELVQVCAFGVRASDMEAIRRRPPATLRGYFKDRAWVDQLGYTSPALACWAHWVPWRGEDQSCQTEGVDGSRHHVELLAAVGSVTAHYPDGDWPQEPDVWMPAPSLAKALGVVGVRGDRWHRRYVDPAGEAVAVERDDKACSHSFDHHYLAVSLESYVKALKELGYVPAWSIRIQHEATPAVWLHDHAGREMPRPKNRYRDTYQWMMGNPLDGELEVIDLGSELHPFDRAAQFEDPQDANAELSPSTKR